MLRVASTTLGRACLRATTAQNTIATITTTTAAKLPIAKCTLSTTTTATPPSSTPSIAATNQTNDARTTEPVPPAQRRAAANGMNRSRTKHRRYNNTSPLPSSSLSSSTAPKINIIGLEYEELQSHLGGLGIKEYQADHIFTALYRRGCTNFDNFPLKKESREALKQIFDLQLPIQCDHQTSVDGTQKWLAQMNSSALAQVESVFIPNEMNQVDRDEEEQDRESAGALCVSSQVGCSLKCAFCHTGTMNKKNLRNLSTAEIVGQLLLAKNTLKDWHALEPGRPPTLTNIVFMGMGEPLYNYKNVLKALKIMNDGHGLGLGKKKITVSTSGIVPNIYKLGAEFPVNLAISLHAVRDDIRDYLVPINKVYPIAELMKACHAYPGVKPTRKMTFEYVMLKGVNDSDADARELVRLLKDIPALINLIPFNPWNGAPFESSSNNTIHRFASIIEQSARELGVRVSPLPRAELMTPTKTTSGASSETRSRHVPVPSELMPQLPKSTLWPDTRSYTLKCTIRWPRGRDIMAACGQLAVKQLSDVAKPIPSSVASTATPAATSFDINSATAAAVSASV